MARVTIQTLGVQIVNGLFNIQQKLLFTATIIIYMAGHPGSAHEHMKLNSLLPVHRCEYLCVEV